MTLSLEESAARLGGFRWMEMRLFELLGGWVACAEDYPVKAALDSHSQHAAWRAQQWWDRLPVLASIDRSDLVRPAPPALDAAVTEAAASSGVVERLAGAYRVLMPRLAASYRSHRTVLSGPVDGPVIRTLGHVLPDLTSDWSDGEALLQGLLTSPAAVESAAAAVARLETLLAASS